jgi:hypothetical protein
MSNSVLYMSMSVDGYIAGPNDEPGNLLAARALCVCMSGYAAPLARDLTGGVPHPEGRPRHRGGLRKPRKQRWIAGIIPQTVTTTITGAINAGRCHIVLRSVGREHDIE